MLSMILVVGVGPAFLALSFSASRAIASSDAKATVPSDGSQVTDCSSLAVPELLVVTATGDGAVVLTGIRATFPNAVATIDATMFEELGSAGTVALKLRVRLGVADVVGLVSIVRTVVVEAELGYGVSAWCSTASSFSMCS